MSKKAKVGAGVVSGLLIVTAFVLFQNCSPGARSADPATNEEQQVSTEPPTIIRTDFMTGLNSPWDMAFTSEGHMLFTEKCMGLSIRKADGTVTRLFGTTGSALVANDMFCEGQSGIHGVAIDPQFSTNRFIYVFMASNLLTPRTNRVVRLVVDSTYSSVSNRVDIITNIAFKDSSNSWGGAGSHSGGRIRFGPDGALYVTTGDNHNGPLPQSNNLLGGKILRVDRNGNAAPGNNAPGGFDSRIFTYGHRNVQGITFRPSTGAPFVAEHGPGHSDEVTTLVAGGNAGWDPVPDAGVTCADNYCGYISNNSSGTPTSMTDLTKFPNALQPVFNNGGDSQGMGPTTFLSGNNWKGWSGRLLVGIMAGQRIDILELDSANKLVGQGTIAGLPAARPRSLVQGVDGNLYVATDEGSIWKITPQ